MSPVQYGSFPLTRVDKLPNVTVAFPGEHWSDRKASESIVPGEAVVPVNSGGKLYMRRALDTDAATQLAIALRTVMVPDINVGSIYSQPLGPNEIMNLAIPVGEYVHAYYSGVFHLTLIAPDDTYAPADLIGWDANGARPTGKGGTGSWAKNAAADIDSIFEVQEWRPISTDGTEGILTVRSLRGQF
jgi:hypothetical protein